MKESSSDHKANADGAKGSAQALEAACLPETSGAELIARAWLPAALTGNLDGPTPLYLCDEQVWDMSRLLPTVAEWLNLPDLSAALNTLRAQDLLCSTDALLSWHADSDNAVQLLAPVDLQPIKACGVTFAASMVERVIEERAGGDASRAAEIRALLHREVPVDLASITPGSEEALQLREALIAQGLWSQYLEVGIGPDAEVFTKGAPLSAVGHLAQVGIRADSTWNNPEPEVVCIANARGEIKAATLGNDVNLRDFEGRSALLLGKAKDNNASCSIGPFLRLLDSRFDLAALGAVELTVTIDGEDGFRLRESGNVATISRPFADLMRQTFATHQYPDGVALFTGSLFAPTTDRDEPEQGFTHKHGDRVTISCPHLGTLSNTVTDCLSAPPWTFGLTDFMRNLASRGLL